MGRTYEELDATWQRWIAKQPVFFVGTAPLAGDGHVNVSPKGPIGSFAVRGPREVAYLDVRGSGAETAAHLRENGRIVIMFCAFQGPPRILRLHGRGEVVDWEDPRFEELAAGLEAPGVPESRRSVVRVDVTRIADSCGYTLPLLEHAGDREHYDKHARKRLATLGADGMAARTRKQNAVSLDGLPAFG
ncbi:pyridoxamine 5'-phosphate oxidase family protein [Conexibacter sp. SYSU D00693]|uniref:pyridoxamine 5'-phosphate oxidase family protein n=1 Tax=Conexibacter sp. SYSU D00693 TaxID=2812560 RepID=UPI00196A7194|nr:pyridoxamine 5'-phosphate oxidase family protein [Conexibacter sp. SYSU D00693]